MTTATFEQVGQAMLARALGEKQQIFGSFFLSRLLGLTVSYDNDTCLVTFDVTPALLNPQGTLHGGVLATAMDISMGHLLHHVDGAGATLEMKVQYLAAAREGAVVCRGTFLRKGRRTSFLQSEARHGDGTLLAHATSTWTRPRTSDGGASHGA
ncbi:MAG: PaaI family thioesterase [Hyphomicrobiales bacterium]|nr:PaaI family thioesterase [Hyphomicrobiales bacterium]